jgi:hypothetical protein
LILEGKVDHEVIECVYAGLYLEYVHLNAGEEEQNKKDALDVRERMGKIVTILKEKKVPETLSPSNHFIDIISARYEFDFQENYP